MPLPNSNFRHPGQGAMRPLMRNNGGMNSHFGRQPAFGRDPNRKGGSHCKLKITTKRVVTKPQAAAAVTNAPVAKDETEVIIIRRVSRGGLNPLFLIYEKM